jgi:hypothetical protein
MDLWELKVHGGVRVCEATMEYIFGVKIWLEVLMKRGRAWFSSTLEVDSVNSDQL